MYLKVCNAGKENWRATVITPPNNFFSTIMLARPLYFLIFALVAAVGGSAQAADACTLSCVQAGLANSTCSSLCVVKLVSTSLYLTHAAHIRSTDLSCVCNSTSFQQTAENCLAANCTAAD